MMRCSQTALQFLVGAAGVRRTADDGHVHTSEFVGPLDMGRMALGQGGLSEEPMWDSRAAEIRALHPRLVRLFIQEYFKLLPAHGRVQFCDSLTDQWI